MGVFHTSRETQKITTSRKINYSTVWVNLNCIRNFAPTVFMRGLDVQEILPLLLLLMSILLSSYCRKAKKLRPYLKNVPAPEATIRDREAIIEDLSRRLRSTKDDSTKVGLLRGMYLVLPYVPEMKPDWVDAFDRIVASPPTEGDLSYLAKTLSDAHSIYLLKNRGGKEGVPVRVDPKDPDALPVAIQNIKRTLSATPDKFNNDILTANTRLDESRLDLPIDDFLVDLYALGLEDAGVLTTGTQKLTAQQVWPFVAAAYSTNGTPRPCWFIIKHCDEIDQLIAFLKRAENVVMAILRDVCQNC